MSAVAPLSNLQIFELFHQDKLFGFGSNSKTCLACSERLLFDAPLQKPSPSYPIIIKPEQIAAAGFGVVVFALDLSIPPAAGKDVGTSEFVDGAVFWAYYQPAVFVRVVRPAGEADRFGS